jgi:hypothetical protein
MGSVPALAALLLVALVLLAEAGLLIGVVLPAASLVLGLGVLAGAGLLPLWAAAATAASATVVGAALGHRAAPRDGAGHLLPAGGLLRPLVAGPKLTSPGLAIAADAYRVCRPFRGSA